MGPTSLKSEIEPPGQFIKRFPNTLRAPMGEHHKEFWAWAYQVAQNEESPRPFIAIWPRGGGKSTNAALAVTYLGFSVNPIRKYALYVSGTQEQADKQLGNIAGKFEQHGIGRSTNQYGSSKGWRRNQLRTANGFNVEALGLDVAIRGIKLDDYRPDLIIFDDLDSHHDSPKITEKKILTITDAIIPAGSTNCAYLGIQNLIIEDGIFARLEDGRADFLANRIVQGPIPAIRNLVTEEVFDKELGRTVHIIVGGEPTWEGQNLEICQKQILDYGYQAFLREAQHEVAHNSGFFFNVKEIRRLNLPENISGFRFCRAWDLAATEGGGDYTAGVLIAMSPGGAFYVLDVVRGQFASNKVRELIYQTAKWDVEQYGKVTLRLPEDPSQAGKDQALQFKKLFAEFRPVILRVTGRKSVRARGFADAVNNGQVSLIPGNTWQDDFKNELKKFREDEEHLHDDQVDAAADAYNYLYKPPKAGWGEALALLNN